MSNHRFAVFLAVIVGLGVATGYWLATLPKLAQQAVAGTLPSYRRMTKLRSGMTKTVSHTLRERRHRAAGQLEEGRVVRNLEEAVPPKMAGPD